MLSRWSVYSWLVLPRCPLCDMVPELGLPRFSGVCLLLVLMSGT